MHTFSASRPALPADRAALPAEPIAPLVQAPLLAHRARMREPRPGLRVHVDDAVDQFDGEGEGRCDAGLHLVMLLEGQLDLRYGSQDVQLSTCPHAATCTLPRRCGPREAGETPPAPLRGAGRAQSVLMHLAQPEPFRRISRRGRYARRLSLGLSADWLAQLQHSTQCRCPAPLAQLLSHHLRPVAWQPTARALTLAEQIVRPPALAPWLQAIHLESHVLALLGEVLHPWQEPAEIQPASTELPAATLRRLRELREFLQSPDADGCELEAIARRAGMGVNRLQAQFRQAFGVTVMAFLRDSRLQRARLALERDGLCIKQAAAVAGYTSAANFSTAFTRHFGLTPKAAQRGHAGS